MFRNMHNHIWIHICWIKHVSKFHSFFNYVDDEIGVFFLTVKRDDDGGGTGTVKEGTRKESEFLLYFKSLINSK
jgi:hypothetical protein